MVTGPEGQEVHGQEEDFQDRGARVGTEEEADNQHYKRETRRSDRAIG